MKFKAKDLADRWKQELKEEVKKLPKKPKMAIIIAKGYSEASNVYVNNKIKVCKQIGVDVLLIEYGKWVNKSKIENLTYLINLINILNHDNGVHGIIVQKPFPTLTDKDIDNLILPKKDIDGFTNHNKGALLAKDDNALIPATALGCSKIIEEVFGKDLSGKKAVILNRSGLIGLPLQGVLINNNCTITTIHSRTSKIDVSMELKNADIVITGCGKRKLFNHKDFGDRCRLIIDCSMTKVEGVKGVGDVDLEDILLCRPDIIISSGYEQTGILTTVALADNLIQAYKLNQ